MASVAAGSLSRSVSTHCWRKGGREGGGGGGRGGLEGGREGDGGREGGRRRDHEMLFH